MDTPRDKRLSWLQDTNPLSLSQDPNDGARRSSWLANEPLTIAELDEELAIEQERYQYYGGADPVAPPPKATAVDPTRRLTARQSRRLSTLPTNRVSTFDLRLGARTMPGGHIPTLPMLPSIPYGGDNRLSLISQKDTTPQEPEPSHEVTWDGPNDPANPQNWTNTRKWCVTLIVCVMTVNVTFATSAPAAAARFVAADFGISAEVADLITSMFLLGYVLGPLIWGPGSELFGRRPIFVLSLSLYTILHLGQALAPNIAVMLVTRFLGGFFAVSPLVGAGGLIADIWNAEKRGTAMSLFAGSVFLGPVTGPIVAGFILQAGLIWRWVFWVGMIFAGVCTGFMILTLPETYAPVILLKKAKALRKADPVHNKDVFAPHEKQDWTPKAVLNRTLFRPFQMLASELILVLVTLYLSLVYGVLYCLFQAVPIIFAKKRGFTIAQSGLVFVGVGIGTSFGALLNVWLGRHYPRLIKEWRGFPPPEQRLPSAMIGGVLFVIGIFWLGWTGNYASIPWYVPALSLVVLGMSVCMIFISFLGYMVETYLMYSASAFAANTFIRSIAAAAFPLFTVQFFTNVGVNFAATILGLVGLLLLPSPFLFYKYGARIRAKSKFAPGLDLKIAATLAAEAEAQKEKASLLPDEPGTPNSTNSRTSLVKKPMV
ncbi:MFS general substrate transporter [Favolaschia claudopus]|uniref:MFS general substrate transporter n=1 Tax=Favolaschia claudopus TaxID=2862362 RepID=A0AAW0DNN5_9AGAR